MFVTIHRAIVKQTHHRRGSAVQICPAELFYLCLQRVNTLAIIRWIRVDLEREKDCFTEFLYAKQNLHFCRLCRPCWLQSLLSSWGSLRSICKNSRNYGTNSKFSKIKRRIILTSILLKLKAGRSIRCSSHLCILTRRTPYLDRISHSENQISVLCSNNIQTK